MTPPAHHLNSGTLLTGQRRVSISTVRLIMEQESSWRPTQYKASHLQANPHTDAHMSTQALNHWSQVIVVQHAEKDDIMINDNFLLKKRFQHFPWDAEVELLNPLLPQFSNSRIPSRTALFKCIFQILHISIGLHKGKYAHFTVYTVNLSFKND